mmetsp:Transcript_1029/g.1800  ORF Transcript_1029/g.1800 Transcript_1029/m.1800 type:complete len:152 (+) Transcript_1029:175-630(+)
MTVDSACFNVRVDATCCFFFEELPDARLAPLTHPAEKGLQTVLGARHKLSPTLTERVQAHIRQREDCMGAFWYNFGACCCCVWGCADQTESWDWDRDATEVKRQVVGLLSELLGSEDYEILESSSLPGKHMFDPAQGGLAVLKLYIKPPKQ